MALSRESLEFLSLFTYLKEVPLAYEYSQEVTGSPLAYDTKLDLTGNQRTDYFIIDPTSAFADIACTIGRGLLSFELNFDSNCQIYSETVGDFVNINNTPFKGGTYSIPTVRESDLIIVRDQSNSVIPRDYYRIDYQNGRIRWPSSTTPSGALNLIPTSIDYRFHMVSLIEGYPNNEEPPELPIVTLNPVESTHHALQIGPGIKYKRNYILDIYANSNVELMDLTDCILTYLYNKRIPVVDFNRTGMPLESWGVINNNFIQDIDYNGFVYKSYLTLNGGNGNILHIMDPKKLNFYDPRTQGSDLYRHNAKIAFTSVSFSDRDPKQVGRFNSLEPPIGGFDSLTDL